MTKKRNHLAVPRDVFSTTELYRMYVLKELTLGKSIYGKQIYDTVTSHFEGYPFPVSYSTIYNTLHKLEEEGLIESTWKGGTASKNRSTRHYKITDEGIRYFKLKIADTIDTLKKNKGLIDKFMQLLS